MMVTDDFLLRHFHSKQKLFEVSLSTGLCFCQLMELKETFGKRVLFSVSE